MAQWYSKAVTSIHQHLITLVHQDSPAIIGQNLGSIVKISRESHQNRHNLLHLCFYPNYYKQSSTLVSFQPTEFLFGLAVIIYNLDKSL